MTSLIQVTLLRHGRSSGDDEGVHEGRYDAYLTEAGRQQARLRAQRWAQERLTFDQIICSPLLRARTTAEIIGEALQVPVALDPEWMEMDNGPLAGLPLSVAAEKYPMPSFRNPYEPFWGTGESDWEFHCRAARAVEQVVRRGSGRYLVVAHGGIINAALRMIAGTTPPVNGCGIWFELADTGYVHLAYDPGRHRWLVREFHMGFE